MHVVIAGGTGLIGRALAAACLARGDTVSVLTRRPDAPVKGALRRAAKVLWTPNDPNALARHLRTADVVVNLIGENLAVGRWTAARKRALYASRVESGRALTAAIRLAQPRPKVLLQASAVGYYGDRGDALVGEDTPPGDDFLARLCVDWEASTAPVEALGVRRVVLRTGVVLTREGGALPRLLLPVRLGVGGPLGSGRQWMPWIHMEDEVGAMLFLMAHDEATGPFNLTAPQPVTNAQLVRALAQRLHRPAFLPVPAFALRLLLGEMSTVLLASQRVLPNRLLSLGYAFRYPTLDAALDALFAPPPAATTRMTP